MTGPLVFIDTETTSLRPDRRAWEIGLIVRDADGEAERHFFIERGDLDLGNADPASLRIGRFYERHPSAIGGDDAWSARGGTWTEQAALLEVERLTRGAHLVGAVPNFDAEVLGERMRWHDICPSWHYHLIDVETLAVGYLARKDQEIRAGHPEMTVGPWPELPWRSDDLSRALGVVTDEAGRHTAIGDARWARDLYDAVMGGRS